MNERGHPPLPGDDAVPPRLNWRAMIHWRKAQLTRRGARNLREYQAQRGVPVYDISWAVIAPSDEQDDGWDYHLIRTDWGYGAAVRLQAQIGGWSWIMKL